MKFIYKEYHKTISNQALLDDLKRVVQEKNLSSLSMKDYSLYGAFNDSTFIRRFGSWNNALSLAGISLRNRFFSEQELLNNLEKVWVAKGKQPTRRDMDNKVISSISSGAYVRKYGNWTNALLSFVQYINESGIDAKEENDNSDNMDISPQNQKAHPASRDVNLRLRFKVMQRDNFRCCLCGASPANDPSVTLHIDHVIPWSKGGETTINNLQTLCSKCNWGKGNL